MNTDPTTSEDGDPVNHGYGPPIRITDDWLLRETHNGNQNAAGVLMDRAFQAVGESGIEPEIRDYITGFLNRLLVLYDFNRRDAASALSGLSFPRRDLRETDLPMRALTLLRSDMALGAVGAYLGNFFEQAITRHRLGGAGARALEPALESLYPFHERGRPKHPTDVQDMLAARILLLMRSRMCDARGRRLAVSNAIRLLADIPFPLNGVSPDEVRPAGWPDDVLLPMEDPLLDAAAMPYPVGAYRQAWETMPLPRWMTESSVDAALFEVSRFPESLVTAIRFCNGCSLQRTRRHGTLQINHKPTCE